MESKITSALFSFSGASVCIGVIGFFSAIITIFVNVNQDVSIKWLIFVLLLSVSLGIILLKVIFDLLQEKIPAAPFENPIRYVETENVFVIRRNENFINNIVVGCYAIQDEIDRLAYLGVVHLVQDKLIQIKIHQDYGVLTKIPSTQEELKSLVVRPVVPVTALQSFSNTENNI